MADRLLPGMLFLLRVDRVQAELDAGRTVPDDQLRQHAQDCALLAEQAYWLFETLGLDHYRAQAVRWQERAKQAHAELSPAWRRSRDAQILASIDAPYRLEHDAAARPAASNDGGPA